MKNIDFDNLTDDQLDRLVNDFKTINNNIMQSKEETKEQVLKKHVTIDEDDALYYEKAILNAMEEYAKIKLKEAFINGFEQGFERGQSGLGIFNLAEDKANEYCQHRRVGFKNIVPNG